MCDSLRGHGARALSVALVAADLKAEQELRAASLRLEAEEAARLEAYKARRPTRRPSAAEAIEASRDAESVVASPSPSHAYAWTFEPACPQFGQKPIRFDGNSADDTHTVEIFEGEPVTDRRSTFQAFLAVDVDSMDKARWALRAILQQNKCGRATHNMMAYRFTDESGAKLADNDDDGEDGAGSKMAYLLEILGANGVLVVVSRWYGGIHLGPDRFKHIAKCTQKILEAHGYGRGQPAATHKAKRNLKR